MILVLSKSYVVLRKKVVFFKSRVGGEAMKKKGQTRPNKGMVVEETSELLKVYEKNHRGGSAEDFIFR